MSLLFTAGSRPTAPAIAALVESPPAFGGGLSISYRPPEAEGWLELLGSGLTFDLTGLAPAPAAPGPPRRHAFGLDGPELPADLEAVRLAPGTHIAGGGAMLPVVRAMTAVAALLTQLDGVRAVCWHPAGTCIETVLFGRMIAAWSNGGPFPALGLTTVVREDSGVRSEGLGFFIGQELWLEAGADETPADTVKLAVRLIHRLVEEGAIGSVAELVAPDGSRLDVEPSFDKRLLRVWRRR